MKKSKKIISGFLAVSTATTAIGGSISNAMELNVNNDNGVKIERNISSSLSTGAVKENLNLRKSPSIESSIILTMKKGSSVTILSESNGWAKVRYGSKEGYASSKYIVKDIKSDKEEDNTNDNKVIKKSRVTAQSLNVRAGASTNYKILGAVKKDTVLEIYGIKGTWASIKYNGKNAYVSTKYLEDIVENTTPSSKKMEVTGANLLNVRSGPGTNYAIKGSLKRGQQIHVISEVNGWAKFVYENKEAYVSMTYLKNVVNDNNANKDNNTDKDNNNSNNNSNNNNSNNNNSNNNNNNNSNNNNGNSSDKDNDNSNPYAPIIVEKNMFICGALVHARVQAGENFPSVAQIKHNTPVYVKKHLYNGWSEIVYEGYSRYVLTKNLSENPTQLPSEDKTEDAVNFDEYRQEVLRLVNIEREKAGLGKLVLDSKLSKIATLKSEDMATNDYFSHQSPTYGSPFDMIKSFGIQYSIAGENIAKGHSNPSQVVDAWMNSPGHRENIMKARFTRLGVGIAKNKSGRIYWTQMFTDNY